MGRHPGGGEFVQSGIAAGQGRPGGSGGQFAGLAGAHVAGQGFGDLVGMGELQVLHVAHEIPLAGVTTQAWVEGLLLSHGGDATAGVIVTGVEQAGLRQRQQLFVDRGPEGVGIALLKVAAAATTHEQRITAEGH